MPARPPGSGRFREGTCLRWGGVAQLARVAKVVASRHFFMRQAQRAMRERHPPLPLTAAPPVSPLCAVQAADVAAPARSPSPAREPRRDARPATRPASKPATRPAPKPARRLHADHLLASGPSFVRRAEARFAPGFFADITDDGRVPAVRAVSRFEWTCPHQHELAHTFARSLDLLPRERCPPAWSTIACSLATVMFEDICPGFARARTRACELGVHFSLVPLRGNKGWRARARWAGLLESTEASVE